MAKHVTYSRYALYRSSWDVDVPDDLPESEWEEYIVDTLDVLNRDEDEEEFIEYEDGCELCACC